MKLIAWDTSQDSLLVAASHDGRVVAFSREVRSMRHSSALVPAIAEVMKKAGWKGGHVDALAVGLGPGSFTGLRVGVATAKILGRVWKKKIAPIASLELLALSSGKKGRVTVCMDARKGKIYTATYEISDGKSIEKRSATLMAMEDLTAANESVIIGDALPSLQLPEMTPEALAVLAENAFVDHRATTPDKIEPVYLYPKDCNVTIKKK